MRMEPEATDYQAAYDTLFGYLLNAPDLYARAALVRHLDNLYELAKRGSGRVPTVSRLVGLGKVSKDTFAAKHAKSESKHGSKPEPTTSESTAHALEIAHFDHSRTGSQTSSGESGVAAAKEAGFEY